MQSGPKIPYGGKATAIFGLILIVIFWIGTAQRVAAELAEARASELSKNANLALARSTFKPTSCSPASIISCC